MSRKARKEFTDVELRWATGKKGKARAIDNNAAWSCACGEILLGPTLYAIGPCPSCGKQFEVVPKGPQGSKVDHVREVTPIRLTRSPAGRAG